MNTRPSRGEKPKSTFWNLETKFAAGLGGALLLVGILSYVLMKVYQASL